MKKILIAGANSYIGTSFEEYMYQYSEAYQVDTVDMIGDGWKEKDFFGYDTVFYVAGIAHIKETKENSGLYYRVNKDLAVETAEKSLKNGVKQFVYLSSMSVYGMSEGIIYGNTEAIPKNNYGKSKLEAEGSLKKAVGDKMQLAIIRPPMVYGKGCKGNYSFLSKLAKKLPLFPKVNNYRSMIYIDNLCEFVRLIIQNTESGTFFPQNSEYSNTSQLVKMIAEIHNRKIMLVGGFTWLLKILSRFTGLVNKAFGNLVYDKSISIYKEDYTVKNLEESIKATEI